jgi:hypothetical protein
LGEDQAMDRVVSLFLLGLLFFDSPLFDWFVGFGSWFLPYALWALLLVFGAWLQIREGRRDL